VASPLLVGRDDTRTRAFVVLAADRGLCGGYNGNVVRAAEGEIKDTVTAGNGYRIIAVGRKVDAYFRFRGYDIADRFSGFSENPTFEDARRIGDAAVAMFQSGEVDAVELVYTRFVSLGTQEVVNRPLVPLGRELAVGGDGRPAPAGDGPHADYEIEPSPAVVLDALLPRYVNARVYAALLNAAASEQASRQRAMKSATDNAEELIKSLSRIMNRARQDSITTEIMEIVGGAEALSEDEELEVVFGDTLDLIRFQGV
jgi:F-type H+-transporting ATPase subunit gamma